MVERVTTDLGKGSRMPRTRNLIDCRESLHVIKDKFQKQFMAEQCRELLADLDSAIRATIACAPADRRPPYVLNRDLYPKRTPERPEDRLEQAIWEQWSAPGAAPVSGVWHRILSYQMPLQATRQNQGWGKVDLVGITEQGLPVIVELKRDNASDTPAKMLVQAAAYAIALQKVWTTSLAVQWRKAITKYDLDIDVTAELAVVPLVCVAPLEFWKEWVGPTARAKKVSAESWQALDDLVEAFRVRGLPTVFVEIGPERWNVPEVITTLIREIPIIAQQSATN